HPRPHRWELRRGNTTFNQSSLMTIPVNNGNGKVLPWFRSNAALIVILVSVGISIGRNWQQIDALKAETAELRVELAALQLLLESRSTSAEASETGRRLLQKIDGIEA